VGDVIALSGWHWALDFCSEEGRVSAIVGAVGALLDASVASGRVVGGWRSLLPFDFGGDSERLRHVTWDAWFETFHAG
jgi:hypothetical protein